MADTAHRTATWEDVLAQPEGETWEVIGGELEAQPRPLPWHGFAQTTLSGELAGPFIRGRGGPGGWWIVIEPDVRLGPSDIVAPDIVGWRRDRVPRFPAERPVDIFPDWVCEVLSPSTLRRDRIAKADLYLRAGVDHYCLIDPEARTLEALAARDGAWVRLGAWSDGATPRIAPFAEIELDVGALFPPVEDGSTDDAGGGDSSRP